MRPERITKTPEVVRASTPITDPSMKDIPLAYLMAVKNNENLDDCCRDFDNMHVELQKTDPALESANKLVVACGQCGKKQTRFVGGSANTKAG